MLTVNECYKSFVIDKLAVTEWHNYFVIECYICDGVFKSNELVF